MGTKCLWRTESPGSHSREGHSKQTWRKGWCKILNSILIKLLTLLPCVHSSYGARALVLCYKLDHVTLHQKKIVNSVPMPWRIKPRPLASKYTYLNYVGYFSRKYLKQIMKYTYYHKINTWYRENVSRKKKMKPRVRVILSWDVPSEASYNCSEWALNLF